jgi:hypothetical protein
VLNKVGLADENIMSILMMISKGANLKKLNISGNKDLSPNSITQILSQIRNRFSNMSGTGGIQDLELGKLNFNNNDKTFKELAELLLQVKSIKSLSIQKIRLNDQAALVLVEGLVRAQNLENLRFEYNNLTHVFLDKLCKKLSQVGFSGATPPRTLTHQKSSTSSILQSESDNANSARILPKPGFGRAGLNLIALEGNPIGDRGADVIASLI